MLAILQNTPLWVYVVFLILMYYGLKARKPQHESRFSLLSTPLALLVWSLFSLNLSVDPGFTLGGWFIALTLGALSAWLIFSREGVKLDDPETGLVVPGTWKALMLLLLFFAVNYYIGYQDDVHPEHSTAADMLLLKAAASGFVCGLISTRSLKFYWLLRTLQAQRPSLGAQ
ncbi:hypothetical protein K5E40_15070 [Pseudomonas baetica]|uniref:DUF6622 family protein n=1 Tax=Pseudomonas baetica TaxID=674054 RepID=UPI001C8CE7CE|nr:DUF6622 family protein [Pseudomonas baetica]MBX9406998.1 hypothetical protein [Pseudomonas baetica]